MWEDNVDLPSLHINRAKEENIKAATEKLEIMPIDDHKIHIDEHTRYVLSEYDELTEANMAEIGRILTEKFGE